MNIFQKFLVITDTHFGCRNDSNLFHSYMYEMYENFWNIIDNEKIDTILHLGDVFDRRKFLNFKTLNLFNQSFLFPALKRNINLVFLLGNHDIFYKNTNELNSIELILQNINYNKIEIIKKPIIKDGIGLIPWIFDNNDLTDFLNECKINNVKKIFGHLEIADFDMGGTISEKGIDASSFNGFDIYSGHFHKRQKNKNITYLGSPLQFTWSDYNSKKGITIFDGEKEKFIENKNEIFKIFDYDDVKNDSNFFLDNEYFEYKDKYVKINIINKKIPSLFDCFIQKLNSYNPFEVRIIENNFIDTEKMNLNFESVSTLDLLSNYVDELQLENSNKIKENIIELYNLANFLENSN